MYEGESIRDGSDFMKIRLESDDDLPQFKITNILEITIVTASVFEKNSKILQY